MSNREKDRITSLVLLFAAVGICIGSLRLSLGALRTPGPGFFSFLAGMVLGMLSFVLFLRSFKGGGEEEKKAFWPNPKRGLKMTYVVIALFLYAIGMDYLGFFTCTLLFLGFLMKGIEPQKWSVVLVGSILSTAISYGIFKYWLDVPLPGGIAGF